MNQIPFTAVFSLSECAAVCFSNWRTSKNPSKDEAATRRIMRSQAVEALRFLWATGNADQRATVTARVAIWMERPTKEIRDRVLARERAREGK